MIWPSLLQTILVGTDRRSLPADTAEQLRLSPSDDPVAQALQALARAALLKKAGFRPEMHQVARQDDRVGQEPAGPVLPTAALGHLQRMLQGTYREGLPELLGLIEAKGYRLPPELLPDLLDQCMQQPDVAARMIPLMGARGRWLAAQNVRWQALANDVGAADWFTAPFELRRRLLADTRQRNPMLATAWLEKTWAEEKAEDKVAFLQQLGIRLSELDLELLERAFQDKNREVRLAALGLLVRLPESPTLKALNAFFKQKLAGALTPDKREKRLLQTLPDLSDEALKPWFDLLSKSEKVEWRSGLLQLFVRFVPLDDLVAFSGMKPADLVSATDGGNHTEVAEALLDNLLRHADASWIEAIWKYYGAKFRHALWQKPAMQALMAQHVESLMQHLAAQRIVLDYDSQFVLRTLENYRKTWSKALLHNVLQQYRTAVGGNMPGWHYAAALQTAAWHCDLTEGLQTAISDNGHSYQPKEWSAFQSVLYFRKSVRQAMETEPG
ncbi:MAG: DUF5691 domain-containing protein [Bacteroidetes bacterium]|nr:DUF5691 domain-containing protein [Bacteroidota bacterium]